MPSLKPPQRPVVREGGRQPSWGTGWEVFQAASMPGLTELGLYALVARV